MNEHRSRTPSACALAAALALLACGAARADEAPSPEGAAPAAPARVRVAVYELAPLMSVDDVGRPRGLYVDLLEYVARKEGWALEYVPGTWDECLRALEESKVDLVPVVGYSEARAARFAFNVEFPVLDWGVVFTREGSPIQTVFDLKGQRVAALRGSIYTQNFRSLLDQFALDVEVVEKSDYHAVFRALAAGEVDAAINAQLSGATIAARYHLHATQIYFSPVKLSYAAPRERRDLLRTLDRHFAALKAQPGSAWYELLARWMPGTPARPPAWVLPLVLVGGALLAVSLGLAWALRRQVTARTAALVTADANLRESEALLRTFSDAIPDPIFMKDLDCRWLFANPGCLAAIGRTREQVIGKSDAEIYDDPAIAASLMANDRRIMARGVPEVVEETVASPSGLRIYLSTKVPYRGADGRIVGIIGSARDITDRIRAEEAVRQSEHRFRALNERTNDVILVTDEAGVVGYASPSLERAAKVPPEALVGSSCFDAVHPDDRPALRRSFDAVLADPAARPVDEVRVRGGDGAWSLVQCETSNLLDVPSVRGVVLNCRDVTAQRRAEEQLRQAQKLESIGRLAGGVAHDFNNLLTVVLSCAEALEERVARGSEDAEDVEQIREAGARATELTRQLLAFARKQVIAPVPLDLNDVVRGSEKLLRRVLGEDVEVSVSLHDGLWATRCDRGQLEQVIMNLVVNARDAMPRGGRLALETANVPANGEVVRPAEAPAGDYVRLAIRDSGRGMTPDVKAHLFEPFFTTKTQGKGTGLGLATVYGIVKQSDGYIHVESEPGHGTLVAIWLPRTSQEPAGAADPAPAPDPSRRRGTETVLVVEDDPRVREMTVRALRSGGYDVVVASSAAEALALDAEATGRVRLLVTDVIMPGLDGRALATELVRRHPALRVLYVSGYTQDVIAERGVIDAGLEYLPKPFTAPTLLARVRAVLDARA